MPEQSPRRPDAPALVPAEPKTTLQWLVTVAAILVVSQTVAILLPVALCIALLTSRNRRGGLTETSLVLLLLALALVNSQKWPDADLGEYYRYLDYVANTRLQDVLFTEDAFVSIDPQEVLFKVYVWAIAQAGGSKTLFTFLSTLIIYGALAWVCTRVIRSYAAARATGTLQGDRFTSVLVTCAALLIGVTFSVTAHLTRQYLAGAVFFAGLFGFLAGGRRRWLVLLPISLLVHRSGIVLFPALALALIHRHWPRTAWVGVLAILIVGALDFVGGYLDIPDLTGLLKEDGEQGPGLMALDAAVVVAAALVARRELPPTTPPARAVSTLVLFSAAFAALLFVIRDVPLLHFRSYFYLEFVRTPLLALVLFAVVSKLGRLRHLAAVAFVVGGVIVWWARTASSEFSYSDSGRMPITLVETARRIQRIEEQAP